MNALVADAHLRNAVAGLRALAAGGLNVVALGGSRAAAGIWSRNTASREVGPTAEEAPAAFVAKVADIASRHGPLVVYPGQESSIDALMTHAASLPDGSSSPYPSAAALHRVRDKRQLVELAAGSGLRTPATVATGTAHELLKVPLPEHCVIKPLGGRGRGLPLARALASSAESVSLLRSLPGDERLLVQERFPGALVGVGLVVDRHGRVVASLQQCATRTWPVEAGGSSMAVTVPPDEELIERSAALLRDAGYWGLAHLQFLYGAEGPVLIDVNTRFYGSLPLALAAGVNLPAAWHAVATEEEPPPFHGYRVGVTYRWFVGDLSAAYKGFPERLRSRAPRPRVGAMWAADDPLASAILAGEAVLAAVGRQRPLV